VAGLCHTPRHAQIYKKAKKLIHKFSCFNQTQKLKKVQQVLNSAQTQGTRSDLARSDVKKLPKSDQKLLLGEPFCTPKNTGIRVVHSFHRQPLLSYPPTGAISPKSCLSKDLI
jgi:hypothetical protein